MTAEVPVPPNEPNAESALSLRASRELQQAPALRPAGAGAKAISAKGTASAPTAALGRSRLIDFAANPGVETARRLIAAPPAELTWSLASVALAAGVGWIYERRRRMQLQIEADSAFWPSRRGAAKKSPVATGLDVTLPNSRDLISAPVSYASVLGETASRREATLVDLHELHENLEQLRVKRKQNEAAVLLEQHLIDFRYTSPWIFLELRELYRELDQPEEWELARDAFRARFGQNPPQWNAPSTATDSLIDDQQLCQDLLRKWPYRDARLFILRWMLGDALTRKKNFGPPLLTLGIYRDMMLLDSMLDEVMATRPAVAPKKTLKAA